MSKFSIQPYTSTFFEQWNKFIERSENGTLFHRLDFLSYHGDKFKENEHHLMWFKGDELFAVMPFAIFEENGKRVGKSPYGASFGGIVHTKINFQESLSIVEELNIYLKKIHLDQCQMMANPYVYNTESDTAIEFALLRSGFRLETADIFQITNLINKSIFENLEGRNRTLLKKIKDNFTHDINPTTKEFFLILKEDKIRHNAKATHTEEELNKLKLLFPDKIFFETARDLSTGKKAAICYFLVNNSNALIFYLAQENEAIGSNGQTYLIYTLLEKLKKSGYHTVDFGGSTIGYHIQNLGVSKFKEGFGAKPYLRKRFVWNNTH